MATSKTTQKCPEGNTKTSGRYRLFTFTAYNVGEIAINCRFYGYGKEICPDTGRPHLQGFAYWDNAKTLSAAIKVLRPHHTEVAIGTLEQNIAYCSKGGDYTEVGDKPSQGARTDLLQLKDEIFAGKSVDEICLERPIMYHQYGRTLQKIEDLRMRQVWRTEMTTCTWYAGPTGVGKSHQAFAGYSPTTHYVLRDDVGWWEDYTQQDIVVLNDFRGEMKFNELLQMIDKWPFFVKRRNRPPLPFVSKHVIITCPKRPEELYFNIADDGDRIDQLLRRIDVVQLERN